MALVDANISLQDFADQKAFVCLEDAVIYAHLKKENNVIELFGLDQGALLPWHVFHIAQV